MKMRKTTKERICRTSMRHVCLTVVNSLFLVCSVLSAQTAPDASYWLYVAAESDDEVALVRFDAEGARVEKIIPVGVWPTEIEGPHGLRVSPDGDYWYLSLAHGNPYGSVYKYRTGSDDLVASVEVGMYPATLDIAASTGLLYVVNFDLHGEMKPSTISVVETETMTEVADVEVGIMPHSSRLSRDGNLQYSVMMMTDELVETDAFRFEVLRRLSLSAKSVPGADPAGSPMPMPEIASQSGMSRTVDRPTWVHPGPGGQFVYVACNGSDQVKVVDLERWEVVETFETGRGPYNIDVTSDGRLMVVTYKTAGATGVWDLREGRELARLDNSRGLTHGVVVSPDSKYAFVSVEGVAGQPGALDIIDLETLELAASLDVGRQASGITFWKMR
jgi:DNA-binding beta-propeller fold protein YncE